MSVSTVSKSMLYCPKCKATYEEGKQRFCSNDDTRLLASGVTPATRQKSVFAHLVKTKNPNFFENGEGDGANRNKQDFKVFEQPLTAESFQPDKENSSQKLSRNEHLLNAGRVQPTAAEQPKTEKPRPRLIKPNEIKISQAKLGDRSVNPAGRLPLTWENTAILLGQTVKGRYLIVEQLSEDETSIAYLAQDKLSAGKKAIVRVLMDEKDVDDFERKIFAEERVSLSHINHPHIAHLIDSGKLIEGKEFIISEYVAGVSLKEKLRSTGQFDARSAARIIRQAADALGEAHQNGVLHRNLKPENIILTSSPIGEQIKVTDFAVFDGLDEPTEDALKYLSPEQLEGRLPNFSSDIYTLAVIAYQMLTARVPFNSASEREMLKWQKQGLQLLPTNLRLDLSIQVDEVLEKALSYKPSDRYPKARDFGDAFYNALTTVSSLSGKPAENFYQNKLQISDNKSAGEKEATEVVSKKTEIYELIPEARIEPKAKAKTETLPGKISTLEETPDFEIEWIEPDGAVEENVIAPIKEYPAAASEAIEDISIEDLPEETEEPKPQREAAKKEAVKSVSQTTAKSFSINGWAIGAVLLVIAISAMWVYVSRSSNKKAAANSASQNTVSNAANENVINDNIASVAPPEQPVARAENPPQPRSVVQPPNTVLFENSVENPQGGTAKNFRDFSFYYPNDWVKTPASGMNFADVARFGATGTPIEQFLVSSYESTGTFDSDREIFKQLVEKSKKDLEKALNGKFQPVSEGETKINGDWRAYELKFQGEGLTKNGDKVTLWGRRLWLPAAKSGVRAGFVLTLIATSISPEIKSVGDVGVKGELAQVLSTFEPTSLNAKP